MEAIRANINTKYKESIRNTMNISFPDNEKLDVDILLRNNKVDTYALIDYKEYIGFMTVATSEHYAYLYFLAVDIHDKGYGSKALDLYKKIYKDKVRVIDLDIQDDKATDSNKRIRRKAFYLRNNYYDINLGLEYLDMDLELLSSINESPDLDEISYILRNTIKDDLVIHYKRLENVPRETY